MKKRGNKKWMKNFSIAKKVENRNSPLIRISRNESKAMMERKRGRRKFMSPKLTSSFNDMVKGV